MARQQRMVGIIDLTGKDSDEVQEVVNDIGRSMIRGRSEMKPCHGFDANKANIPVDNLGRQSLGANASPPLPLLPVPSFQDSSSFRDIPLQDRPDTINPLDGSKAKKICKWEHYPNPSARDVLPVTASNPDKPGLSHHQRPLLRHFTHDINDPDNPTFRWDLGDSARPGVVAPPVTELITMPPTEGEHKNVAQNLPVRSPLKPTRGGMSSGGFGATGRPSSVLPITHRNLHLPDSGFFRRTFDPTPQHGGGSPSGIRGPPRQQSNLRPHIQRPLLSSGLVPTRHWQNPPVSGYGSTYQAGFSLDSQLMSSQYRNSGPQQHANTSKTQPKSSFSVVMEPTTLPSSHGQNAMSGSAVRGFDQSRSGSDAPSPSSSSTPRLGRPRKSSSFQILVPSLTPKKRGRPFKNSNEVPASDPNPKKRGRPFKTAESAAKAAAGSDSADGLPKKRGRPFKVRTQLDIPVPEPVFFPFICEWEGCPAELQNLETLEAHVFNVHDKKQSSGSRLCLWDKCGAKHEPSGDMTKSSKAHVDRNEFKNKMEWKEHIKERHLIPFAWYMGDGPRGTSLSIRSNSDSSPWLKDKDGRQVTPSVKEQPIEEGRAKDNNARRFVRKIDGIHYIYERIRSPEAYMKVQAPPSDGDDEDDNRMDESF